MVVYIYGFYDSPMIVVYHTYGSYGEMLHVWYMNTYMYGIFTYGHRIGWWEHFNRKPLYVDGKNHGFL